MRGKDDFSVTSIFKIIIRIFKNIFEFWVFTQKMFANFQYFFINGEKLIQQVCLRKYVENEILTKPCTKQKTKEEKKNINPTS